ncbi:MAG: hypothetical protein KC553_11875, partial [Nitrospina sp.]|nr:hypothetical protein [Nitrospina sp.]
NKLPGNRKIEISKILNCETLESVHIVAAQSFIRDLTYKSPKEFADSVENIFNLNLLEVAQFQKYIEIKATRDIFIHNQGITNEIYVLKAGSLSRARAGEVLPINNNYFLQSYETCIQLTEFLRDHLHDKWHSPENEKWKQQFKENSNPINPSSPPHQQV